jgi:hypothetical protein
MQTCCGVCMVGFGNGGFCSAAQGRVVIVCDTRGLVICEVRGSVL